MLASVPVGRRPSTVLLCAGLILAAPRVAAAADDVDELARKVSNPAAFMISVPIHGDLDFTDTAAGRVEQVLLDVEPVLPFRLNDHWNIISHTDFPLVYVNPPGSGADFGLGDISQALSFTPSAKKPLVWAIGAQASLPTATSRDFGSGKFSIGPSLLLLSQTTGLTSGLSASHMWSVAGRDDRANVSLTEVRPFLAWHMGGGRTISANIDASYDWQAEQWDVPLQVSYSKVLRLGSQAMSLSAGGKYWLDRADGSDAWGVTAGVVLLFPEGGKPTAKPGS